MQTPTPSVFLHTPPQPRLTVSPVALGVVTQPGFATTGGRVVVSVALVDTTGLLAGRGETTAFAVLDKPTVSEPSLRAPAQGEEIHTL